MAIILPTSNNHPDATHVDFILDNYRVGEQVINAYKGGEYYRDLRVKFAIGKMIREFHGTLGCGGNFKNGCLYREEGVPELWRKGQAPVVCDHVVPISELVSQYQIDQSREQILKLIFSPVARISSDTDSRITASGFSKIGYEKGSPFSRYSAFNKSLSPNDRQVKILTHLGDAVDLVKWTEDDHWALVIKTKGLDSILNALQKNFGI